jgi:SAM-dependent methyltransferase
METVSPQAVADKRGFYRLPRVAENYDLQRFGGPSGAWVNAREIALARALLPPTGRILDLGCGTGRLSRRLIADGYDVVLLDASEAMLARAVPATGAPAVLGDAFALPFAPASFDAIVALRVAFHFAELGQLVHSVAPLLRPGGRFVFDTYRWTPRSVLALAARRWGGKVYVHGAAAVAGSARAPGLTVAEADNCFLFSPYLYRLLPLSIVHGLDRIERALPSAWRARTFWALERPTVVIGAESATGAAVNSRGRGTRGWESVESRSANARR